MQLFFFVHAEEDIGLIAKVGRLVCLAPTLQLESSLNILLDLEKMKDVG